MAKSRKVIKSGKKSPCKGKCPGGKCVKGKCAGGKCAGSSCGKKGKK